MELSLFDYELPRNLIASTPASPRDHSRLMVVNRATGTISHHHFYDLPSVIDSSDVLVANRTRVIPARMYGKIGDRSIEILLVKQIAADTYEVMGKPGKKFITGTEITFSDPKNNIILKAIVRSKREHLFTLQFSESDIKLQQLIHAIGVLPLPPYIEHTISSPDDYQTVYAHEEGSIAAPTAGLHFTPELIQSLKNRGNAFETVNLHVGLGTFLPVKHQRIEDHPMHSEYFELDHATADRLNHFKKSGRHIIAIGTTSVRVLESCANADGALMSQSGDTDIFIYPGYQFRFVDAIITNFHLPKSTLLMLVSAFAGRDLIFRAYEEAIRERYRFYSFGDAMLIL